MKGGRQYRLDERAVDAEGAVRDAVALNLSSQSVTSTRSGCSAHGHESNSQRDQSWRHLGATIYRAGPSTPYELHRGAQSFR